MRPDPDRPRERCARVNRRGAERARVRPPAAGLALVPLLSGCIVPLPLEQQRQVDGGQTLVVKGATDPFGTLRAMNPTTAFSPVIDLVADNSDVVGRLYALGSGSCCELDTSRTDVLRLLGQGMTSETATPGRYTINFQPVFPCAQGFTVNPVFLVLVVASGGFVDAFKPQALGEVDANHYWTVTCP